MKSELEQAREAADGQLDDATLAAIIARAVASVLEWHLEAPEHTRSSTLSSRSWRPAGGPRGGDFSDRGGRGFEDRPPRDRFDEQSERGPRSFGRGPRDFDRRPRDFDRGPRDFERGQPGSEGGARDFERGPRDFERGPKPRGGGGFKRGGFKPGDGFKPRGGPAPRRRPR